MITKRFISAVMLALMLIANLSTFGICGNFFSQTSNESDENGNVPDCCRNGMCPHHKQRAVSIAPDEKDACTCNLLPADQVLLTIVSSVPAIMPAPIGLANIVHAMNGPVYSRIQAASLAPIPPTPPPEA